MSHEHQALLNAQALRVLRALRPDVPPTPEEMSALLNYRGWGDEEVRRLSFDYRRRPREDLAELISATDAEAIVDASPLAPASVPLLASYAVVSAAIRLAGTSKGLRVLDPCPGSGGIVSRLSKLGEGLAGAIAAPCPCPVTSAVLQILAPAASVIPSRIPPPGALFDIVAGVAPAPSGAVPEGDRAGLPCRFLSATRTAWYVARAVLALRPGGVAVILVDRSFLDRPDQKLRLWVAARAEMIASARIPTEGEAVDLVVLRRRPRTVIARDLPWINTYTFSLPASGRWSEPLSVSTLYEGGNDLMGAWQHGDAGEYTPVFRADPARPPLFTLMSEWIARLPEGAVSVDPPRVLRGIARTEGETPEEILALDLAATARRAFALQASGEGDPLPLLEKARRRYADLVRMSGPILQAEVRADHALRGLISSPEWSLLRVLETPGQGASRLLRERSIRGRGNVSPSSPAEALAGSLDRDGRPDVARIARDLSVAEAEAEVLLGDSVFRDPAGRGWRHAPEYLSGDINARLTEARGAAMVDPRFRRNVEALEKVLPRGPVRIAPSSSGAQIDDVVVPLGASWVPEEIVRDFAVHLCGGRSSHGIAVRRVPLVGTWTVRCNSPALLRSVENVTTWGVPGMPAVEILAVLLNLRQPRVTRTEEGEEGEDSKVVDEDATAAAAGKAEEIRAEWTRWIREDGEREKALLDAYAHRFGGFVRRVHDGGYLSFPGLSLVVDGRPFEPRSHQRALVERIAGTGEPDDSCLAVHLVGYGKTFSGIAGAVRRWHLGLSDLTIIVVPGGRVFGQWKEAPGKFFPGIADKFLFGPSDWARDGSAFLRRIVDGEASFVILTYEQFAAIPPSSEMLAEHLSRDLPDLREAVDDADGKEEARVLRAALGAREKAIGRHQDAHAKRIQKMRERAERTGKALFTWEEVTGSASRLCLVFDEWQYLKRIPVPTKMERVYGLPRGESYRAVDGLAKVRRCLERGGKAIGLTGSPITNTLAEGYVAQEFFQPEQLRRSGIRSFDDWASAFTEPRTSVEMDAVGRFRGVTRLGLVNLPELLGMLGGAWDYASPVPEVRRPDLVGGQIRILEVPGSPELRSYIQVLADRAEAIRDGMVDPSEDNMLMVVADGRRASMWNGEPGETFPPAPSEEGGRRTKLDAAADELWKIYAEHYDEKGVSLVFLDMGTPKGDPDAGATPAEIFRMEGLYGELRGRLLARGVLPEHVAFVHDARTDAEMTELFARVNAGEIRILMGSTAKLGVGTNPQERVVMVLHLDAPWRPDELIQRGGRGRRDGNRWRAMHEVVIVTSGSFDTCLWQLLRIKADFVSRFQEGIATSRSADDVADLGLTASMAVAIALGDPKVLRKVALETSLAYLERQRRSWEAARETAARDLADLPARIARLRAEADAADSARGLAVRAPEFSASLRDTRSPDRLTVKNVAEADARVYALSNTLKPVLRRPMNIGEYRGQTLTMEIKYGAVAVALQLGATRVEVLNIHSTGTFAALDRELGMLDVRAAALRVSARSDETRQAALRAEISRPWDKAEEASRLLAEYEDLCRECADADGLVDRRTFSL